MAKTLLLTSAGIKVTPIRDELLKILPKPASKIKLAHVVTASNVAEDIDYVRRDKRMMKKVGFQVEDIDIVGKTEKQLRKTLKNKDVVYVQGGNGFFLLKHIRKSGFDKVIKDLIKRGTIYIGVSAGTYVACPTIEMHTWKDKERNQFGVVNLAAMNLVPFLITVHYNRVKYRSGLKEGITKSKYTVKILNDDQAILVKSGKIKLVGRGKEVKLS